MRRLPIWIASVFAVGLAATSVAQETESTPASSADPGAITATEASEASPGPQQRPGGGKRGAHHCAMHGQGGMAMTGGHHGHGKKSGAKGHHGMHRGQMRDRMMRHHKNMEARLRRMEEQLNILQTKIDQLLQRP